MVDRALILGLNLGNPRSQSGNSAVWAGHIDCVIQTVYRWESTTPQDVIRNGIGDGLKPQKEKAPVKMGRKTPGPNRLGLGGPNHLPAQGGKREAPGYSAKIYDNRLSKKFFQTKPSFTKR